jgi:hypothetical protein
LLLSPVAYFAIVKRKVGILESELAGGQTQLAGNRDEREQKTSALERESLQEQEQLLGATATTTVNSATDDTLESMAKVGCGGSEDVLEPTQPHCVSCCDQLAPDGIRVWGPRAMPIVLLFSVIQACTWLVLRSVIGRTLPSSANAAQNSSSVEPHSQ